MSQSTYMPGQGPIKVEVAKRLNRNLGLFQAGSLVTIDVITPAGKRGKFRTNFIGFMPKDYVLIQLPDAYKLGNFSQYMGQGASITVRGVVEGSEGSIVAFASTVRQTLQIPSRILVLEFPKEVSLQSLRSATRVDTNIKAKIKFGNDYWLTSIVDLSIKGCQLQVANGDGLLLKKEQEVQVIIEDFRDLKNLSIRAAICNSKALSEGLSIGLQFADDSTTQKQITDLLHYAITNEGI